MNKTGQILSIVPTQAGGYASQGGWVYTFNMTIQCADGQFTGEIGSKTEQYPLSAGEQISVQVTNSQNGVKFKKFNPQYAAQDAPQGGQQGRSQPAQSKGEAKDDSNVDWDAKDLRMARMNALTNSTRLICLIAEANKDYMDKPTEDPTLLHLIRKSAEVLVIYIYNGLPAGQKSENFEDKYKLAPDPHPDIVSDDAPPANEDDVPPGAPF